MSDIVNASVIQSPIPSDWVSFLDGMTANGQFMTGQSNYTEQYQTYWNVTIPNGTTLATFDTGTSFSEYSPALRTTVR